MNGSWQAKWDQAQWGEGSFCIAWGDWEENEATVSHGFCARSCKSCQHFPIRMSRNALGEYSEVWATKLTVSGHILVACGALALTWNVKDVPVKICRNEAFCTGFPAVIPILWHCSHGRCMALLFPHFRSVTVISTTSDTEYLLCTLSNPVNSFSQKICCTDSGFFGIFFCCLAYKFVFRISTFSLLNY